MQDMKDIFTSIESDLKKQEECKDVLRKLREPLESRIQDASRHLARLHTEKDIDGPLSDAKLVLPEIGRSLIELEKAIPNPLHYYKYVDLWRSSLQDIVSICCLIEFMQNGRLIEVNGILDTIDAKDTRITLEDYLLGVCSMVTELSRLCMNRVTLGDYDLPRRMSEFCASVFSAFKILNFRNDSLRRNFDRMKYDVSSAEKVNYEIAIRGLASAENNLQKKRKVNMTE